MNVVFRNLTTKPATTQGDDMKTMLIGWAILGAIVWGGLYSLATGVGLG